MNLFGVFAVEFTNGQKMQLSYLPFDKSSDAMYFQLESIDTDGTVTYLYFSPQDLYTVANGLLNHVAMRHPEVIPDETSPN